MIRLSIFRTNIFFLSCIFLASLLAGVASSYAANSLFSEAPVAFATSDGNAEAYKHIVSVNLDLLLKAHAHDKILAVLDNNSPVVFTLEKSRREKDKLIWTGSIDPQYGQGKVFFFIKKGRLYGYIEVDGKKYEIAPFRGTPYYSVEDKQQLRAVGSPYDALSPALPSNSTDEPALDYSTSSTDSETTIDLLMLYSPEMADAYGDDLEGRLEYIVEVANQAYIDSQINLKLRIVQMLEIDYDNDNDIYTALTDLTNAAGAFANIPRIRNDYGADLVTFVRKFNSNKSYCGLAWLLPSLDSSRSEGYGYSVIEDGSDNGYYCLNTTLAHELGHNMGCAHDKDHASSSGIFDYSYGYDEPGVFATIMSYDSPHINYFSNPNIQVDGHTIGVPDEADNARTIEQTKTVVAAFRDEVVQTYDGPWLSGSVQVDNNWKTVNLAENVEGAAIFVGPPTSNDPSPGVIRLENVGTSSFQVRFQEWQYEDGSHGQESLDYVEIPLGRHEMSDGSIWEVMTFSLAGTGDWVHKNFSASMPSTPAVFCSMQTYNGYQTAVVRVKNVSTTGFDAAIFEEEALMDGHAWETVACLAVYSSSGSGTVTVNGVDTSYEIRSEDLDDNFKTVLDHELKLEEEQSKDSETDHVTEVVNVLLLGDKLLAQDVSFNGGDTFAIRQGPEDTSATTYDGPWLSGSVQVDNNWKTVNLAESVEGAAIFVGPPTSNDPSPGVIRLENVGTSSFQVRFQEWQYEDGSHGQESLDYVEIPLGRHEMSDGSIWEVMTFSLAGTGDWVHKNFSASMPSTPAVFCSMQTYSGSQPAVVRVKNVSTTGFDAAIFEEEALMDGHAWETVACLAVYSSSGSGTVTVNGVDTSYEIQSDDFDHNFKTILGHELKLEEEQSKDSETAHVAEVVNVLLLGDKLLAQAVSFNGGDTFALRQGPEDDATNDSTTSSDNWYESESWIEVGNISITSDWKTITLSKTFSDPIVIVGAPTSNGADPCVVRLRNVSSNSFEIRLQEWIYLDGEHTNENVSYMVIEAGSHSLPDGSIWEAGKFDISGTLEWKQVSFASTFASTPVVFQTIQTFNGSQTVVLRQDNASGDSFYSAMEEEEALNDGHADETVGYLAVETTAPSGTSVITMQINQEFSAVSSIGKEFRLQEETSKDSETSHAYEELGILSLDGNYIYTQIESFEGADTVSVRMR